MHFLRIPTFIINLRSRVDRKAHILKEFLGHEEFDVIIAEACEHKIGAIGLWNTIKHIIKDLVRKEDEFVLVCEDDHMFTPHSGASVSDGWFRII